MIKAVMRAIEFMEEKGMTVEERLTLLGSVSRLNHDAVSVKAIFDEEGLSEEEQRQAIGAIRAMIRPAKKRGPKPKK